MKLIMKNIKFIILTIILVIFILNINIVINSTKDASYIFFNKIFISIFPFIILSDILIYYNYHIFLKKVFGKIISKLFNVDENSTKENEQNEFEKFIGNNELPFNII